jgi:protoporphyrinogen oxidase
VTDREPVVVVGGGVTGLAAGVASGGLVLEAAERPGGICSSYYVRPKEKERLERPPADGEAYRFELGGGHWIFGGDPLVLGLLDSLGATKRYERRSAVFFPRLRQLVPYPLQENLRYLDGAVATKALAEMAAPCPRGATFRDWVRGSFGPTLSDLFFDPFHEQYTARLYSSIAPQDAYKSPVNYDRVVAGALSSAPPSGYNVTFAYPEQGLDGLTRQLAGRCRIRYGGRVERIDTRTKRVLLRDRSEVSYGALLGTVPLNELVTMAGLATEASADPHTSVLVLNVGALKGPGCPSEHWLYLPGSRSGFHRVGCYSNVDSSFLPRSARDRSDKVSLYIERAYRGGQRPGPEEVSSYCDAVVRELREWQFIQEVEVLDPTWIDVAYTWQGIGSSWRQEALSLLHSHGVFAVGRYGRWVFQGIADSIRDGLFSGAAVRAAG